MNLPMDDQFPHIDLLLRRGGHINRSQLTAYDYVTHHFDQLQEYYRHYQCALTQHPDGFFYLLVKGSLLSSRLLPKSCVHLGMFIALKARDPEITQSGGRLSISQLFQDIETSVPRETLQRTYAPQRRHMTDPSITEELHRALDLLAELRFIEATATTVRPLEAIHRFADLARHNNAPDPDAKLHLLIQRGIVFLESDEPEMERDADHDNNGEN